MCISWTIKCLILLMHGATMKFILKHCLGTEHFRISLGVLEPKPTEIEGRPYIY
jgi:hypothetical protein